MVSHECHDISSTCNSTVCLKSLLRLATNKTCKLRYAGPSWGAIHQFPCHDIIMFNSSPTSATYIYQWIGSALVLIMACCLFSAKPLSMLLPIGPLETNLSEISIKILNFSFMKMHPKISSAKWQPFCPEGDELIVIPPLWLHFMQLKKILPVSCIIMWHYSG